MNTAGLASPDARELLGSTLPAQLLLRVQRDSDAIAYRVKWRGLYRERSWLELAQRVRGFAAGLTRAGFARGDRLAIMGDACEPWLIADLACQCLGGISYGIYPTASAQEVQYQMHDGGARIFVAENQEYVDKLLAVADALPELRRIVVCDSTAMFGYDDPRLVDFVRFCEPGGVSDAGPNGGADGLGTAPSPAPADAFASPGAPLVAAPVIAEVQAWLQQCAQLVRAQDPAFIVYTSGTTGHPKGALISHGRHLAGTFNIVEHYPMLREPGLRTIAYLPMCHVLGRDIAVTLPLISGLVPHYGESVDDLQRTLFEIAPQVLFAVPRYLQKFASQLLIGVSNSTPAKKRLFHAALAQARREVGRRWSGQPVSAACRLSGALALRPALNKIGFDALRLVVSGGAPLPAETMTFWHMMGVNVCEIYGQTETAGAIISGQRSPFPRPGDVGVAAAGVEIRLARDGDDERAEEVGQAGQTGQTGQAVQSVQSVQSVRGRPPHEDNAQQGEILLRTEYRFDCYWQAEQASTDSFADGWLKTGDVGRYEDGRLKLVDRARDFIVTAGGKTLSPTTIENAVRASAYVAEVIVVGHARKYVSALVEIDYDAVADWARNRGLVYSGFTSLAGHAEVVALIGAEIETANRQLARVEQIKVFRILPKALDPEQEGEPVTPTRKVKRRQMLERFGELVESMYDAREQQMLLQATSADS